MTDHMNTDKQPTASIDMTDASAYLTSGHDRRIASDLREERRIARVQAGVCMFAVALTVLRVATTYF